MGLMRNCIVMEGVSVGTDAADSKAIPVENHASFTVHVPAGSSITSLSVYSATSENGNYLPLKDAAKAAAAITDLTAGEAYQLPISTFGLAWMKLVGDAAGVVDLVMKG